VFGKRALAEVWKREEWMEL
jgi:hypothetical protein